MHDERIQDEFETIHQALARLALESQQKELAIKYLLQLINELRHNNGMDDAEWTTTIRPQ